MQTGKLRIAVVGGSLGGLFAAVLLARDGHDVTVFERSTGGLNGRGAGLVGQPDIHAILRDIGRPDAGNVGVLARERITFDRDGSLQSKQHMPQMQISWDYLYSVFRDLIPDAHYQLGRTVQSVAALADAAMLTFDDGSFECADLVVGADGVGSVVRLAVSGASSKSDYAGYVAFRGLIPESLLSPNSAAILLDRFAFYFMPRSHILGYSVTGPNAEMERGSRRYNWVWYRGVPAEHLSETLTDTDGLLHPYSLAPGTLPQHRRQVLVDDAVRLLPPPFADAVAAEPKPFVQAVFDHEATNMMNGRLALLGDAAFVVRPHTAMGVAKAAGDALSLRSHLRRLPLERALKAYEVERMVVGRDIAAYGRRLGAPLG